jgi:hypothetical protein
MPARETRMPVLRWWAAALLVTLVATTPAVGQFLLPLDVSQGAVVNADGGAPYIASIKLQGALGVGRGAPLRAGPVLAVRYANPEWVMAAGGRVQWLLFRFGPGGRRWGFGLAAEHLLAAHDRQASSAWAIADLELLRLGASVVHERATGRSGFELGMGTDLRSLHSLLFPRRDREPFPDIP